MVQTEFDAAATRLRDAGAKAYNAAIGVEQAEREVRRTEANLANARNEHAKAKAEYDQANAALNKVVSPKGA